jgi:hypothetical protein
MEHLDSGRYFSLDSDELSRSDSGNSRKHGRSERPEFPQAVLANDDDYDAKA